MSLLSNTIKLDLYPFIAKVELKNVDANFQVEVGYYVSTNQL
jgi:hypothetical protein